MGGSIGLALRAAGFGGCRIGAGRRASSLRKALNCDAVDVVTRDVAKAVSGSQLVILCTPIRQFDGLITRMAPALSPGTYVTDVASTKAQVVRMAERLLPDPVRFVGSHPMAGSEKTGVEFARADLFQLSTCILTPTSRTKPATVSWMRRFWEALGCRTVVTSPERHDRLLARVSHLPHAVAAALVNLAVCESPSISRARGLRTRPESPAGMRLCGRIFSGPTGGPCSRRSIGWLPSCDGSARSSMTMMPRPF